MPTRLHRSTASAEHADWKIFVVVTVSVGDSAAVKDHAVVKQRSAAFLNGRESREQVPQQSDMVVIDLTDLGLFIARPTVVRNIVMAVFD